MKPGAGLEDLVSLFKFREKFFSPGAREGSVTLLRPVSSAAWLTAFL